MTKEITDEQAAFAEAMRQLFRTFEPRPELFALRDEFFPNVPDNMCGIEHDGIRILARCVKNHDTGCMEWLGAKSKAGYGRIKIDGKIYLPHRVIAYKSGIVAQMDAADRSVCVLHECDNRLCCNPKHLKAGSMSQNMKDCVARGRHKRPGA